MRTLVVDGLDDSLVGYLFKLGYHSPDSLLNAHAEDQAAIPGISEEMALQIQQIAFEVKKRRDEETRLAKERAALEAQAAADAARLAAQFAEERATQEGGEAAAG